MRVPAAGPDDRLYSFGAFIADPVTGTLRRDGVPVPLTLKSFEVLRVLIEHRGQVVEKDVLLKLVWPDTIVEENNLARHISTLRKALNDHPNNHQIIVTVPGRGYRFAAPVQELSRTELMAAAESPEAPAKPPEDEVTTPVAPPAPLHEAPAGDRPLTRIAALAVVAIAALAIVGVMLLGNKTPVEGNADRHLWQLTSGGGLESFASWAPDGRAIAYSSDGAGNFDIWSQTLGDDPPAQITRSPAHDWQPSFSPDGTMLVFRSERDGGGLFVAPVNGNGPERRITNFGYRPQWSRRQSILFYSSNVVRSKLYVVAPDGSEQRRVLGDFLDEFTSYRAAWHPDGERISVFGNHSRYGLSFWTASPDGGAPVRSKVDPDVDKRLKRTRVALSEFAWSPTGDALYLEGRSEEALNIWRVRVDRQTLEWRQGPERLTMGPGLDTNIAVSPDGHKLAFTVRDQRTRLWSFPFDPIAGKVLGRGEPVSASGADALYPDVPPDGEFVVYRTVRRGKHELRRRSLVTGDEQVLVSKGGEMLAPRWSDDGKLLAFRRRQRTAEGAARQNEIVLVSADGDNERLLTSAAEGELTPYDWSADGQWILGSCQQAPSKLTSVCLLPVSRAPHAQDHIRVVASDPERHLYQATSHPISGGLPSTRRRRAFPRSTLSAPGAGSGRRCPRARSGTTSRDGLPTARRSISCRRGPGFSTSGEGDSIRRRASR